MSLSETKQKVEEQVVIDEALEEALDEISAIAKFDDLPNMFSEISELQRDLHDADLGQEVKQARSSGGPSGFADIGFTSTVFVVTPDTEIDDGHPGLHELSECECGANCDFHDSESSDCESVF